MEKVKNKTDKPESIRLKAWAGLNDTNSSMIKSNEKLLIYMTIQRASKSLIRKFHASTIKKKKIHEKKQQPK